jgi:hypothetical protein
VTFHDWLRKTQPLLAPEVLPDSMALVRDGMGLAWDAAVEETAGDVEVMAAKMLTDFEYPSEARKAQAVVALAAAIDDAIDAWIKANCKF